MPTPVYEVNTSNQAVNARNNLNNIQNRSVQLKNAEEINSMAVNNEIKGPSNMDNILNKVKQENYNKIMLSEEDSTSNDRILSSSTYINDSNGNQIPKEVEKRKMLYQ